MCGYGCFAGEGLRGLVICPCILAFIYYVPSKCLLTHINTYIQAYKFPCWHTDLSDTQDEETYCPLSSYPSLPCPIHLHCLCPRPLHPVPSGTFPEKDEGKSVDIHRVLGIF